MHAPVRRAVIFDVEGTLIDCVPQNLESWQSTLADAGLTFPLDVLQLYSGMDGDEMLQILAPEMDHDARRAATQREGAYFKKHFLHHVKAFAGVRDLFTALKDQGYSIGLATDCSSDELSHYRRLLDVDDVLDVVACGDDVDEGKPSRALTALAVAKLETQFGTRAAHAIMVGDTPYDAEAATSAGITAIGLLTGGFARPALVEAGCHDVAPDLAAVRHLLIDQTAVAS
jgi:HAD superfamily hydrolase (TIGR01549 family)